MRIGIDARPLLDNQPTGIGIYLKNIISHINDFDAINEYILYINKPLEKNLELKENFIIKYVPGRVGTLWLRYKVPKYVKNDNLDVFWGTQHFLPKKVKGVKYVLTVHDVALLINSQWGSRTNAFMQNSFLRPSVKDADLVITISESTKHDLVRMCKISENKVKVIYIGGNSCSGLVSSYSKDKIKDRFGIFGDYFLYVGKIEPRKNITTIVRAFNVLAAKKQGVFLILVGGLGWRYKKILQEIEKSQYRERIVMTGYIDQSDKELLYQYAKGVVFISHYEGFGIPILEALSYKTPILISNNSSLPEVGGDAALYVDDENNFNEIAQKMESLLNLSEQERKEYAIRAEEQCNKFSWRECAHATMEIITNI